MTNDNACTGPDGYCPIEECVKFLAGAWTPHILWNLREKPRRFGELKRLLVGVSAKVLTTRLREHEERGLISRHVLPTSPQSVEYRMTALGHEIEPVLCAIAEMGHKLRARAAERAAEASSRANGVELAAPVRAG